MVLDISLEIIGVNISLEIIGMNEIQNHNLSLPWLLISCQKINLTNSMVDAPKYVYTLSVVNPCPCLGICHGYTLILM